MNNDLYFDGKKYISSSRAAKISGYVNDYIGQLCRDGKLECRMVGRSWYVSLESLVAHKNANGNISKNKSQKLIKNSITEDTLAETVTGPVSVVSTVPAQSFPFGFGDIKEPFVPTEPIYNQKPQVVSTPVFDSSDSSLPQEISGLVKQKTEDQFTHFVPVSIAKVSPIAPTLPEIKYSSFPRPTPVTTHHFFFEKTFPKIAGATLALIISFFGFRFMVSQNETAQLAYRNVNTVIGQTIEGAFGVTSQSLSANIFSQVRSGVDGASLAVYRTFHGWMYDAQVKIFVMTGKPVPPPDSSVGIDEKTGVSQGMVVVPVDSKTNKEAVVAKIKNSFSDEVSVEPGVDGESGVITPVFKKVKGDDYLYVLVPIKN